MIILGMLIMFMILAWLASIGASLAIITTYDIYELENMFNPVAMYESSDLNIFGVIAMTIISYALFLPAAIIYWFYILCTIGRR